MSENPTKIEDKIVEKIKKLDAIFSLYGNVRAMLYLGILFCTIPYTLLFSLKSFSDSILIMSNVSGIILIVCATILRIFVLYFAQQEKIEINKRTIGD